jgi:hypothetical protein
VLNYFPLKKSVKLFSAEKKPNFRGLQRVPKIQKPEIFKKTKYMKKNKKYSFWLRVMRFAYIRVKSNQKFTGVGVPGLRDKDNPCDWYAPTKDKTLIGECEADGHYLCNECRHFNKKEQ